MKLIHIVGARPQFIKMAAVSRAITGYNGEIDELIIHTGQHYDYELSKVFFEELEIPKPDYNLEVGSGSHGEQTGEMLKRVEQVLLKERPDIVLVYGDTNSTLAGALAAAKLHVPVAHVEAGLRSFNRRMPEEINRILADHLSTILFCPTEAATKNLKREGFTNIANEGKLIESANDLAPSTRNSRLITLDSPFVLNVGDVMYDSVLHNLKLAEGRSSILKDLGLEVEDYYLTTIHRAENTDDPRRLKQIFRAFQKIAASGIKLICPLHPRTRKALSQLAVKNRHSNLKLIEPVSYLDMLLLEKNARVILTDSGGVQKEAFILRVPCVTLREETEWVETVEAGWNILAGADETNILKAVERFKAFEPVKLQIDPYGNGYASQRIVKIISAYLRESEG